MAEHKCLPLTPSQISKAKDAIDVLTFLTSPGGTSVHFAEDIPSTSHTGASNVDPEPSRPKRTEESITSLFGFLHNYYYYNIRI